MSDRTALRLGALLLLSSALVPLAALPAQASPGCTDETVQSIPNPVPLLPPIVIGDGCDDSTPPDTVLRGASAVPNASGFVNVSSVSFSFGYALSDLDAGPFGFECRVTASAQAPAWQSCTSPVTVSGLPDTATPSYVFEVRAVDLGDSGRDPNANPLTPTVVDTPDYDQTPVTVRWGQDTKSPFVFVTRTGYDEQTPTQPVVTTDTVPIRLNSSEPQSSFECTDNGTPVACTGGRWELDRPAAGKHVLLARTVDKAGNTSAWSDPVEFFVPTNLTRSRGWKRLKGAGYFRGDALKAHQRGARLVLPRTTVGELRLVASRGPRLGKVRLRVGKRDWHVVDLSGPKSALEQYVVIDRYSGVRRGRIVIESLSNKPVVIDAVVARPNRFPASP